MPNDSPNPPIKRLDQLQGGPTLTVGKFSLEGVGSLPSVTFDTPTATKPSPLTLLTTPGRLHPNQINFQELMWLTGVAGTSSTSDSPQSRGEIDWRLVTGPSTSAETTDGGGAILAGARWIVERGGDVATGLSEGPVRLQTQPGGTNVLGIKNLVTNDRIIFRNMGGVQPQIIFDLSRGGKPPPINISEGALRGITGTAQGISKAANVMGGISSVITVGEIGMVMWSEQSEKGYPGRETYVTSAKAGGALAGAWAGAKLVGGIGAGLGVILGGNVILGAALGLVGAIGGAIWGGFSGALVGEVVGEASWEVLEVATGVKRGAGTQPDDPRLQLGRQVPLTYGQLTQIIVDGSVIAEFLAVGPPIPLPNFGLSLRPSKWAWCYLCHSPIPLLDWGFSLPPPVPECLPPPVPEFPSGFNLNFRPIPNPPQKIKPPLWKTNMAPTWEIFFWSYPPQIDY